jgi:exosortase
MFPLKLLIIAVLAHLPIVFVYSQVMWNKGHYQFFPLLFCAVGWLLYDRLSGRKNNEGPDWLVIGLFVLNLIVLFFSIAIHTPVLVIPAIILLLSAVIVDRYGLPGLWATIPVAAVLLIVMRFPTGRDLVLINQMQFLASQLASWILDAFGLVHFREGVILVTEKKQFFTEEACSGIRSLFSTVAAVAIYGLLRHYSIARQIFNLLQSIVWVIAGNAIRVAAVVYLADNGYEQFSHGTPHEMFGLAIFVLIFGVTLSVDRALDLFSVPRGVAATTVNSPGSERVTEDSNSSPTIHGSRPPLAVWGLMGLYLVIFLFSARLTYAKRNHFDRIDFQGNEMIAVDESELPASIEGWTLKSFKPELRDEGSLFAPESFVWTYQRGTLSAIVSLDSPYPEFHDLTLCYRGVGWDVKAHHEYEEDSQTGFSWLEMDKPSEFGRVYFAAYSRDGQLAPPAYEFSASTRVVRNIELVLGRLEAPKGDVNRNDELLPISQIQVLLQSDQPISPEDMQSCRDLFEFSRNQLLQGARFRQ